MSAFAEWMTEYETKQNESLSAARSAVATAPTEQLADFLDDSHGRRGMFLQTTGAFLIGRACEAMESEGGTGEGAVLCGAPTEAGERFCAGHAEESRS